jgi:hypothetical protein
VAIKCITNSKFGRISWSLLTRLDIWLFKLWTGERFIHNVLDPYLNIRLKFSAQHVQKWIVGETHLRGNYPAPRDRLNARLGALRECNTLANMWTFTHLMNYISTKQIMVLGMCNSSLVSNFNLVGLESSVQRRNKKSKLIQV